MLARRWLKHGLLSAAVVLPACADAPARTATTVHDSAGTVVVDHGLIDYDRLPAWKLDSVAGLRIGAVQGDERYQFHRVTDAIRTAAGSVVVLDASRTVRLFDAHGTHLWTAGGQGDGPGEFQYPQLVREIPGDSLIVWDGAATRLSVFTRGGEFVRDARPRGIEGYTMAWGMAGPRLVLIEARHAERTRIDNHEALFHPSDFYLVELDGTVVRELGRRTYAINFQEVDENGAFSPAIFATSAVIAPADLGLWFGDTESYELREETGPAEVRRIVRWEGPDRSIPDGAFDAVLAAWTEDTDDPALRRWLAEYGRTHPRADRYPAYEVLKRDGSGRLWIRDFVRPHEDDGLRRWLILSASGDEVLGRVTHPATFEPLDIGSDWILGVERDSLDVERLTAYGMDVPASATR